MRAPINVDMIVGSGLGARGSRQNRLPRDQRGGQAVVEYLLIAAAIIVAVMTIKGNMQVKAQGLMQGAIDQMVAPTITSTAK